MKGLLMVQEDSQTTNTDREVLDEGQTKAKGPRKQKNWRWDQEGQDTLEALMKRTGHSSEPEAVRFALTYTLARIPPVPPLSLDTEALLLLEDVSQLASLILAFYHTARVEMNEKEESERAIIDLGTELLAQIQMPFLLVSKLAGSIGDREIWLRHTPMTHFQYKQATELLDTLTVDRFRRYKKAPQIEEPEFSNEDPFEDDEREERDEEPAIRLYFDDLFAAYQDVFNVYGNKGQHYLSLFFDQLWHALSTYIPHRQSRNGGKV